MHHIIELKVNRQIRTVAQIRSTENEYNQKGDRTPYGRSTRSDCVNIFEDSGVVEHYARSKLFSERLPVSSHKRVQRFSSASHYAMLC